MVDGKISNAIVALTDRQMSALLAASYPLPPDRRGPFLEECARELSALPAIGDGAVHRVVMQGPEGLLGPTAVRKDRGLA
jgi:hypothetical protein